MQISLILMEEIAKLFLIMFMGYALVKTKLLRVQDSKVVSVILVYLVIPCMIVHAFQIDDSPQVRTGLLFAFAAAAAVHVLFLLFTAILRKPCRLSTIEQLTVIYTNAGILVVPLIQALLGQQYVVYSCGFLVVQLILIWTPQQADGRQRGTMEKDFVEHQCDFHFHWRRVVFVPYHTAICD